jgi:integrase
MNRSLAHLTETIYEDVVIGAPTEDKAPAHIPDDAIIFVDENGKPTCRFGDSVWIVPGMKHGWHWHVSGPGGCPLFPQAKRLMFDLLYHPHFQDLSLSTLRCYYFGLRALARACHRNAVQEIGTFFSDDRAAQILLDDILRNPGYGSVIQVGTGLYNAFHMLGEKVLGFSTNRRTTYIKLRELLAKKNRTSFQHPVIPWRIYKHLLISVSSRVEAALAWLDDPAWTASIEFHSTEVRAYPSKSVKYMKRNFPEFVERVDCMPVLFSELGAMQELARLGILLFTGCRTNEVRSLEARVPEQVDESTFLIYGRTTKSTEGDTYWVTNTAGADAVRLALKVRKVIIDGLRLKSDVDLPLMPCVGNFPNNIRTPKGNGYKYNRKARVHATTVNGVLDRLGISLPTITKDDFDFLSELSRDCRLDLEKFPVGSEFPFSAHQFRRSLAYFVLRSVRIEVGAFKRQFKHLLIAMAQYYSSGVVSSELHPDLALVALFSKEQLLEVDERLRHHLTNYSELQGSMGTSIRRNIEDAKEDSLHEVIEFTRERMLKRVRQGEINYLETPLGACLSADPCVPRARGEVSACLDCKNAILEGSKVEVTYRALRASDHPLLMAQAEHFSYFLSGQGSRPPELAE